MNRTISICTLLLTCLALGTLTCCGDVFQTKAKKKIESPSIKPESPRADDARSPPPTPAPLDAEKKQNPSANITFALDQELIACITDPNYSRNCELTKNDLPLAPRQDVLSNFYISYKMTCNVDDTGPKRSNLTAQLDGNVLVFLKFNAEEKRVLVGKGYGPLRLVDVDPSDLVTLSFDAGCSLKISEIAVEAVTP